MDRSILSARRRTGLSCGVLALLCQASAGSTFVEDFDTPRPALWQFSSGERGRVQIREGVLAVDLATAERGKWAYADLHLGVHLPARIEWEQCVAHDSRHMYFGGALLWSGPQGTRYGIKAGLGGSGLGCTAFLENSRSDQREIRERQWYRLVLDARPDRQVLSISLRGSDEALIVLTEWKVLTHGPFFLRFFQNDYRLGPDWPDGYDQDRGITWVDNLRISAVKSQPRKPRERMVTNPFKVPIVFNRHMRWITRTHGLSAGCIAYDGASWLPLTGPDEASRWLELKPRRHVDPKQWPDAPNIQPADGQTTVFALPEGQSKATFALRAFQFNVEQHGVLEWRGTPTGVEWQMEATATDGVRQFLWTLWRSDWLGHESADSLDVLKLYRDSGRPNRYAEVDVLLRIRAAGKQQGRRQLSLRLGLPGRGAIVPRWPVVARAQDAVPIEAVLVDRHGSVVTRPDTEVAVLVGPRAVLLTPVGSHGIRRAIVRGLGAGDYSARLVTATASGKEIGATTLTVSVAALEFVSHYEREKRSYCTTSGRAVGPLLGDLLAWVPYADLGTPQQRLILGLPQHDQLIRTEKRKFGYTRWRSLPRADIDTYVAYMASSGIRVLRLTPNVNPAEYYLDAGGHVAPHGLEQLAYILSAARRHGMRTVINLFHYPYLTASTGKNPPVWHYFQAGYPDQMRWASDEMWRHLSSYLDELLGFTGQDPAVMAYTVMGENDQMMPAAWIGRAYALLKTRAPQQMVVQEQGGNLRFDTPVGLADHSAYRPASDGGVGYRAYRTRRHPNDCFMAVAARLFDLKPPTFLGEVSCGINTKPGFIVKYRDAMGLALTLQQPMAIAWSAVMLEGQCKAFTEAARQVDWTSFRRARPPAAIIVDVLDREQLARLVQYEQFLSSIPIDYECLRPSADRSHYPVVYDARAEAAANLDRAKLPQTATRPLPLRLSSGNHSSYALSDDRRWLVAYIRNAGHYELGLCDIRSVERYRLADRPRAVEIELGGFAGRSRYRLWDVATAQVLEEENFAGHTQIKLKPTTSDLLVLVLPAERDGKTGG